MLRGGVECEFTRPTDLAEGKCAVVPHDFFLANRPRENRGQSPFTYSPESQGLRPALLEPDYLLYSSTISCSFTGRLMSSRFGSAVTRALYVSRLISSQFGEVW